MRHVGVMLEIAEHMHRHMHERYKRTYLHQKERVRAKTKSAVESTHVTRRPGGNQEIARRVPTPVEKRFRGRWRRPGKIRPAERVPHVPSAIDDLRIPEHDAVVSA